MPVPVFLIPAIELATRAAVKAALAHGKHHVLLEEGKVTVTGADLGVTESAPTTERAASGAETPGTDKLVADEDLVELVAKAAASAATEAVAEQKSLIEPIVVKTTRDTVLRDMLAHTKSKRLREVLEAGQAAEGQDAG